MQTEPAQRQGLPLPLRPRIQKTLEDRELSWELKGPLGFRNSPEDSRLEAAAHLSFPGGAQHSSLQRPGELPVWSLTGTNYARAAAPAAKLHPLSLL